MAARTPGRRGLIGMGRAKPIVLAAFAVALALNACGRDRIDTGASPEPSPSPSPTDSYFPAFWDVATIEEAKGIQARVDAGQDAWRKDPQMVAARFASDFVGWEKIETTDSLPSGSSETGWSAEVIFRPIIGERRIPGAPHHLMLIGLEGSRGPAWFVASLRSDNIEVNTPKNGDVVTSALHVTGRGVAYEATIHTEIRADDGTSLHRGFVMGGAYEPAPFEGDLEFASPSSASGILILSGDTGAEEPPPNVTVVRVRFR
jgi:hypothetical protein